MRFVHFLPPGRPGVVEVAKILGVAAAGSLLSGCRPHPAPAPTDARQDVEVPADAGAIVDAGPDALDAGEDLDAAIAARVEAVRARLKFPAGVQIEGDTLVIVAGDPGAPVAGVASMLHQALAALVRPDRFPRRPSRPTTWLVFSRTEDYVRAAPAGTLGFYKAREAEIDLDVSGGKATYSTAVHELVHQLMAEDLGPSIPEAIRECLSTLYENPWFSADGEIQGLASGLRRPALKQALRSGADRAQMGIDRLLGMTDREFAGGAADAGPDAVKDPWIAARDEMQVRYVCLWMERKGWLWPFYRAYRAGRASDRHGLAAFESVTGMSPVQATPVWLAWAAKLD